MARKQGQLNFSANIEVKKQAALDARTVVATVADLTTAATWQDSDGAVWLYDGLVVAVSSTGELWMLTDADNYTQTSSWKRIDGGGVEAGVASVKSGSGAIEVGGTAKDPTISLKLDGTGDIIILSQSEKGLKADLPKNDYFIEKIINPDDKVLYTGRKTSGTDQGQYAISTQLGLTYDSGTKKIKLTGVGGATVAEVDATDFIKDGMVQSVELEGNNLVFTFNTDAGKDVVNVDLSKFIDVYTAGNGIAISGKAISAKVDTASEKYLTVGAAGIKLSGIDAAIEAAITEAFSWHEVGE